MLLFPWMSSTHAGGLLNYKEKEEALINFSQTQDYVSILIKSLYDIVCCSYRHHNHHETPLKFLIHAHPLIYYHYLMSHNTQRT